MVGGVDFEGDGAEDFVNGGVGAGGSAVDVDGELVGA